VTHPGGKSCAKQIEDSGTHHHHLLFFFFVTMIQLFCTGKFGTMCRTMELIHFDIWAHSTVFGSTVSTSMLHIVSRNFLPVPYCLFYISSKYCTLYYLNSNPHIYPISLSDTTVSWPIRKLPEHGEFGTCLMLLGATRLFRCLCCWFYLGGETSTLVDPYT
jgi:hypothetical protein